MSPCKQQFCNDIEFHPQVIDVFLVWTESHHSRQPIDCHNWLQIHPSHFQYT